MKRAAVARICLFAGAVGIIATLLLLGVLYDRLSHETARPQHITCKNNLYQISRALRMWGMDNGDTYCYNLSTNAGGTLEFCVRDKEGFDSNSFLHFGVMSNELATPRALVCPQDKSKKPALSFAALKPVNVSYRLRTGTNVTEAHPSEIVAVCPVHGNYIQCDGSLVEVKAQPEPWWLPYKDLIDYNDDCRRSFFLGVGIFTASVLLLLIGGALKLLSNHRL